MKIKFFFLLIIFGQGTIVAQSFDDLTLFHKNNSYYSYSVRFNIKIATLFGQEVDSGNPILYRERIIETRLSFESEDKFAIVFDSGPSYDPSFRIYRMKDGEEIIIKRISGLEIAVPGDGAVYVSGHINNMFNKRRKFVVENDKMIEIIQPFYYVGLESETTKEIELFRSTEYNEPVIKLPAGAKVEVLINKNDDYLVRTSFGLTGWIHIPPVHISLTPIKGLYFRGD